jgi:DNA adenine methylase
MLLSTPFQWFGGKGNLKSKLLPLIPGGGVPYCEPFAGAASVFFARKPAPVEILNDLDGDVVNFFRVMQDAQQFRELRRRLLWTPYALEEFLRAVEILNDGNAPAIDRAWAFFVGQNQGFAGKLSKNAKRADWSVHIARKAAWPSRVKKLELFRERLLGCQIDNDDAIHVISRYDRDDAVFYVDPPYVLSTRKMRNYASEPDDAYHVALIDTLLDARGAVVLSGYEHDIYHKLDEAGWVRTEFKVVSVTPNAASTTNGRPPRTELVWQNPAAIARLRAESR